MNTVNLVPNEWVTVSTVDCDFQVEGGRCEVTWGTSAPANTSSGFYLLPGGRIHNFTANGDTLYIKSLTTQPSRVRYKAV